VEDVPQADPVELTTPAAGKLAVARVPKETLLVFRHVTTFEALVVQSPLNSEAVMGEPPRTIPTRVEAVPVPPPATESAPNPHLPLTVEVVRMSQQWLGD